MSSRRNRRMNNESEGTFHLQITSMVDMFTILLVFLLKGYSTSAIDLAPSSMIKLPASTSTKAPQEVVKIVVSAKGIFVEDKKVADVVGDSIELSSVDKTDPSFIRALYTELDHHADKTRNIASQNETVEFDGRILMQADKSLPYSLVKKVMYTAMMAGYADIKLAVLSPE
jgi:biopolymer transport protein ExbD